MSPQTAISHAAPQQTPITGREGFGQIATPYECIVHFYAAFNGRDEALMADNWDNEISVSNDNQLGGIQRSREEVIMRYSKIFHKPGVLVYAEFWDYTLQQVGDFCLAIGRERGTLTHGDEVLPFQTRDTRLFRRVGQRWVQVHHHGSFEDPDLMAKFKKALEG